MLREKVEELNNDWGLKQLIAFYKEVDVCESINFKRIRGIIAQQGWPKISAVGKDGSFAAWAIVQHSNNVAFQQTCIQAMQPLLAGKQVGAREYAELVDRVQRNLKQGQIYGMAILRENGKESFYPIQDEENVDKRRKAIGL